MLRQSRLFIFDRKPVVDYGDSLAFVAEVGGEVGVVGARSSSPCTSVDEEDQARSRAEEGR